MALGPSAEKHRARAERLTDDLLLVLRLLRLVGTAREGARLIYAWAALWLSARGVGLPGAPYRVTWRSEGQRMQACFGDLSELRVLHEVFGVGEYDGVHVADPRVIVDAGSNIGLSVLRFHQRFPRARIVAVEPSPAAFERLRSNTAGIECVELVQAAVTDREGRVAFFANGESWAGSLHAAPGPVGGGAPQAVSAITLAGLVERLGLAAIDLLKLDIEGAEEGVLTADPEVLRHVGVLVFEFHNEFCPGGLWPVLDALQHHSVDSFHGDSENHPVVVMRLSSSA